jgi:glutaminase
LRNFSILTEDPTPTLEADFMQCSVLVHCRDLAVILARRLRKANLEITAAHAA